MEMLEFLKTHTVLYANEHVHFVDKAKKDRLWEEIGEWVGRSGQDGHIMRRATVETAGFSVSAVSATSPNKSRGSVTDVPMSRSNQASVQCTTSATSSSSQYYVPTSQPFGNPPSVSALISGLGDDALNISGYDFSVQTPQIAV